MGSGGLVAVGGTGVSVGTGGLVAVGGIGVSVGASVGVGRMGVLVGSAVWFRIGVKVGTKAEMGTSATWPDCLISIRLQDSTNRTISAGIHN